MKKFILIILFFICVGMNQSAQAQYFKENRLYIEDLFSSAITAFNNRQFEVAIEKAQAILSAKPAVHPTFATQIHYLLGQMYANTGELDLAISELRKAGNLGYAEWRDTQYNPDFIVLGGIPEFEEVLSLFRRNSITRKIFDITVWKNPELGQSSIHLFDDVNFSAMKKLRQTYRLDTLGTNAATQFEKQLAVMNWVHHRWKHSHLNMASSPDALTILKEAANGRSFRCVEYAFTLSQCLQSLGFPARPVDVYREGMSFGTGKSHVVTEVWSEQFNKWFVLDAQNNCYWALGNIPLNAAELRNARMENKGDSVRFVLMPSKWRPVQVSNEKIQWFNYFHYLAYAYSNQINQNPQIVSPEVFLLTASQKPEIIYQGFPMKTQYSSDYEKIYPLMDAVHFDVASTEHNGEVSNILTVFLTNSMPSFDHYLVEMNGKEMQVKGKEFQWKTSEGKNTLKVRAVNKLGGVGLPSSIELNYFPRGEASPTIVLDPIQHETKPNNMEELKGTRGN